MINQISNIQSNFIKSDISLLSEQFLRGETFTIDLSEYVFDNIVRLHKGEYKEQVDHIKKILGSAKLSFYLDLVIIKSNVEITEEQKIVLVRYINICHKDKKYIILYNSNVIYIPMEFIVDYGKEVVYNHVNTLHRQFINKRKIKVISRKINVKKLIPFLH